MPGRYRANSANLKMLGEASGTATTGRDIVWAAIASGGYPALVSALYFRYRVMRTLNSGSFCEDKEVEKLRKLIMLVAMLAMGLVVAAPAIAQPLSQEFSERRFSDSTTFRVDYANGTIYGMETNDPSRPATAPSPPPGYYSLNRPFRNVGEYGYAFKQGSIRADQTIDFSTGTITTPSPDAGV